MDLPEPLLRHRGAEGFEMEVFANMDELTGSTAFL